MFRAFFLLFFYVGVGFFFRGDAFGAQISGETTTRVNDVSLTLASSSSSFYVADDLLSSEMFTFDLKTFWLSKGWTFEMNLNEIKFLVS